VGRRGQERPLTLPADIAAGSRGPALRAAAIDLLNQAMASPNPLVRANAIEALHAAPEWAEPAIRAGLVDDNRGVRFAAAMTIGRLHLQHLAHLLQPLLEDASESVRAAAIFGMKANGAAVDLSPLARLIQSHSPEIRANTALVLGELGDPSAIELLRQVIGRSVELESPLRARIVDMQVAEAMALLGDTSQLEGIRAALFAPDEQGELTALAAQICGRLGDERVARTLYDLATREGRRRPPAEVRMAAAAALARIEPALAPREVAIEYASSEQDWLRAQAALTLGVMGEEGGLPALAALLGDGSPMVQVSAAAAILQIVPAEGGTTARIDTNPGQGYKAQPRPPAPWCTFFRDQLTPGRGAAGCGGILEAAAGASVRSRA
jgi:HEAT repeat protein